MTQLRSYTTVEQSKKLAEILPLESADIVWVYSAFEDDHFPNFRGFGKIVTGAKDIKAWSLAALLNVINKDYYTTLFHDGVSWTITITHHDDNKNRHSVWCAEPLDACYELILKLHDKNLI